MISLCIRLLVDIWTGAIAWLLGIQTQIHTQIHTDIDTHTTQIHSERYTNIHINTYTQIKHGTKQEEKGTSRRKEGSGESHGI